jgi:pimeloyl-ACP methyl ester carboxylesterase
MPTARPHARSAVRSLLGLTDPTTLRPTAVRRASVRSHDHLTWERFELDTPDGDTIPCVRITPDDRVDVDVVALHQHAGDFRIGKGEPCGTAGDPGLAYGLALARRGARVVVPDLLGFEGRQRRWSEDPAADERLDALFRIADGTSLQAKHTSDVAVVTSWMSGTDDHAGELGVIGHSLGGQVALFALAVDPRFTHGVVSCGLGTLASFRAQRLHHNPAWFVPGLAAAGDVGLVAAAVGVPVFVAAGRQDRLFPLGGVREVLDRFPSGLVTEELFDGGHTLPPAVLDAAVDHLVRPAGT